MRLRLKGAPMSELSKGKIIHFPGAPHAGLAMQFRIELLLLAQPVWRRLVVPANYTFWDFHVAIQDVMGWQDKHLHQFKVDDPRNGTSLRYGIPDDSGFHGAQEVLTDWEHLIADHFRPDMGPALYSYDFGDGWQHEITLEATLSDVEPGELPACLEGDGLCPREDCGGPFAWEEILAETTPMDEFKADKVFFDNPRERWLRSFGND